MTVELFRDDSYLRECSAVITGIEGDSVRLDQTVFYPMSGGQPGDVGTLTLRDGRVLRVRDTRTSPADGIQHLVEGEVDPGLLGEPVQAAIDWVPRHRFMRMHTCMHLLCSVVAGGVTGGSIRQDSARLDFDLPDTLLDKDSITAALNALVEADHAVRTRWTSEDELDATPELVRTMSVQPPRGTGRVRLVEIAGVDLQPCGGTHVARTGEIGSVRVSKIEKKGKHNRRVNVVFSE